MPQSAAGPYSQAFIATGQIFCSGQLPTNTTGEMIRGTIAEKTERCIMNLRAVLEEAGSGIGKVVKVVVSI
jgi:enamine deaminase RidA (YjgF/YER057c/UK114 family)